MIVCVLVQRVASARVSFFLESATRQQGIKIQKKEFLLVSIPFIFGFQQLVEGFLWITVDHGNQSSQVSHVLQYLFLIAALSWPAIVPSSIYMTESSAPHRRKIFWLMLLGVVDALYLVTHLFLHGSATEITHHRISYDITTQTPQVLDAIIYVFLVSAPMFFSSHPNMQRIAYINIIIFAFTVYFWWQSFVSVWCFFAAILSALIYFYLRAKKQESKLPHIGGSLTT